MLHKTHVKISRVVGFGLILAGQLTGKIPTNIIQNRESIPEFLLASGLILYAAQFGAELPDLDFRLSGPANKNVINKIMGMIMRALADKHRNRLSHSIDGTAAIQLVIFGLFYWILFPNLMELTANIRFIYNILGIVYNLLPLGLIAGIAGSASHIIADKFTPGGAYLFSFMKKTTWSPKMGRGLFTTGKKFESMVYQGAIMISIALFIANIFVAFGKSITI